jgi:hypothetical protein
MEVKEVIKTMQFFEKMRVGDWIGVNDKGNKYHIHKVVDGFIISFIISKSEDNENYKVLKKVDKRNLINFLSDVNGVIF